jgi:hypothetical protein
MPSIFTATSGTVMVIDATPTGSKGVPNQPFSIEVDGIKWGVDQIGGIITTASISGDSNVQFMYTLRDAIYLTTFGDKMGSLSLSGYLFLTSPMVCGRNSGALPLQTFYDKFFESYVIKRHDPLKILIGTTLTVKAFLLSFQMQITDPQFMLGQFSMQLAIVPPKK